MEEFLMETQREFKKAQTSSKNSIEFSKGFSIGNQKRLK
jgi:hypothetical protein